MAYELDMASVADKVSIDGERVRVKVGDKEVAVISVEDLEFLEEVENDLDLLDALKALQETAKDKELISWEKIKENIKRQSDGL